MGVSSSQLGAIVGRETHDLPSFVLPWPYCFGVVKIDVDAVGRLLTGGRCIYGMASFTLDGESFDYLKPDPGRQPEEAKSWTYGNYPKIRATVPLADGGTVIVYAVAERWNPSLILASWADDGRHSHWAWVPAGNVERVGDSECDIEEYRRCPENLRHIRWGARLPGFLPSSS